MRTRKAALSSSLLLALGVSVAGYLLYRQFSLIGGAAAPDICAAVFGTGCDAVLLSAGSTQLGLPLAGWGVIYYLTVGAFLLLGWSLGEPFKFEAGLGALLVSLAGSAVSVALLVTMLAGNSPSCPLCVIVHLVNFALVFALFRMMGRSPRELLQAVAFGFRYLLDGKAADPVQARWKLLAFFSVALVALVGYQWVFIQASLRTSAAGSLDPRQALAAFQAAPQQNIPLDPADATVGPPNAPDRLIVFSDFQCPACKSFSRRMASITESFAGKLQVVFKHFPLGKECNSSMRRDLHPRACDAAYAAEAARKQGKFWEFHDALFASDLRGGEEVLGSIAGEIGLDLEQFEKDRKAVETIAKVQSDIELANSLGVNATPTTFWNGRRVRGLTPQLAQLLIAR